MAAKFRVSLIARPSAANQIAQEKGLSRASTYPARSGQRESAQPRARRRLKVDVNRFATPSGMGAICYRDL
jgi:hypothetical protein